MKKKINEKILQRETEIKNNIRKEIENSAKSKAQIADEVGIARPTLSQYLSGKASPSIVTLALLCEALDCSSDEILGLKKF